MENYFENAEETIKELSFYDLRDDFHKNHALLFSTHLTSLINSSVKNKYFFLLKKRYNYLLKEFFSLNSNFVGEQSTLFWEFYYLVDELLFWKETSSSVLKNASQYRSHENYMNFLSLVKEVEDFSKKTTLFSLFKSINLSH